ncbi:MAG: YifB family Mg chelatase-like AAA ATPase [Candidatus Omnitrophica bacterium]|nr:YifB family Mg chelatase-like AAA ATPase [Candidatus Omnitrophota bacterium]
MLAKINSFGILGLDAYPVTIEVDVSSGLPATTIVGLPDDSIRESKERVRSAIKNSGYDYPAQRIIINLSPADVKKEGPSFDLAIALGILAASQQIDMSRISSLAFLGELSLDGQLQPVNGALSIILGAIDNKSISAIVFPTKNQEECSITDNIPIVCAKSLKEVVYYTHCSDNLPYIEIKMENPLNQTSPNDLDFADVKGQYHVKRGLEIAAAGGHNCLLIGPPGSGKTMLAQRFPTILPDMTKAEILETTKIYSVLGQLKTNQRSINQRPIRSPHHTSSAISLVGGGSNPRPGEVTLSHNGVLFLDELPEFNRNVLEALRQPLEDRVVTIARASRTVQFPAQFIFIAAMNPCPCGWLMDTQRRCQCQPQQIQRYMSKISGPLLDRIDLHLQVPNPKPHELLSSHLAENSLIIKKRTLAARDKQTTRFHNTTINCNAQMDHQKTKRYCTLSMECQDLLKEAIEKLGLSARAHDKILRIARTIADLDENQNINLAHLAEAIGYRNLDRHHH